MEIITAYATKNDCYKKAQKMTPKGIVVHSTGANNPYLKRYVDCVAEVGKNQYGNHWNNPSSVLGRSVCVHSFIGYALNNIVKVANILPYDFCCWGVGSGSKGSYNYDPAYIQFEMCEDDCRDKAYFETVYKTAAEYCAFLCKKFNISVENIVSHKEAHAMGYGSNHGDPNNWWDNFGRTMNDFRATVKVLLNSSSGEPETKPGASGVAVGDIVKIASGATYWSGKAVPAWVIAQEWIVKSVSGDRVVIDKNVSGTNSICSPVSAKFLSVVKASGGTPNIPPAPKIRVGSTVRLNKGAKTYTGGGLASFVYTRNHIAKEIKGDRVVITYGGVVVAAVKLSDLTLIS